LGRARATRTFSRANSANARMTGSRCSTLFARRTRAAGRAVDRWRREAGGDVGNGFAELFDRRGFSSGKKGEVSCAIVTPHISSSCMTRRGAIGSPDDDNHRSIVDRASAILAAGRRAL
jgi:hypothetical protein